ncbi:MAG: hypothetical protein HY906_06630 [Deltaproteobacteria bacterium]|nr:hypothetical protein [Deltaproteobacteria bacterium]
MSRMWLLRGPRTGAGGLALVGDSKAGRVDVVLFDRDAWALLRVPEEPPAYAGLVPEVPAAGLYISSTGLPCYLAEGREVRDARAVLATLGDEGRAALAQAGDPDEALMRLRRAY